MTHLVAIEMKLTQGNVNGNDGGDKDQDED